MIFSGATRVVDLGAFVKRPTGTDGYGQPAFKGDEPWELKVGLPDVGSLADQREYVGTGTTIRLVVGSDDSDARMYDVLAGWMASSPNSDTLLSGLSVRVTPVDPVQL